MNTENFFTSETLQKELGYKKNIAVMFRSTAISMIISELTGVVAVLIDGIMTSKGLGVDAYSGISLVRPFTSLILMVAGFLSIGCNLVCSRLIGVGKKKEANEAFNISTLLSLLLSVIIILLSLRFPQKMMMLSGVKLSKYTQLNSHMYGYLKGYIIGIPALILIQVFGPILVMDNGKRLFTISSVTLCAVDIIADALNVFVFHGGAFGMGLATSVAYIVQALMLLGHFIKRSSYFHLSPKACKPKSLIEIFRNGTPALIRKFSVALRDIVINYFNILIALSTAAIAARGIQSDLFQFLFCIPTGLGRTLVTMTGIYYSAKDLRGLKQLLSYAVKFGMLLSGSASVITFFAAPHLIHLYSNDPEVISLTVFSIRWMSVALVFDTLLVLIQYYLQGTDNLKYANFLSISERFTVPTVCAIVMGILFGSRGILASVAVSKILLVFFVVLSNCVYNRGIPREWLQIMFLPKGFGGKQSDNMYAEIQTLEDAVQVSRETQQFCLDHHIDGKKALMTSLCVEEMAVNVIENAEKKKYGDVCIDYRVFISGDRISLSLMDLSQQFDPVLFYEQHQTDSPEEHIGIRMVARMAKDIRYFSTFKSNNLLINL